MQLGAEQSQKGSHAVNNEVWYCSKPAARYGLGHWELPLFFFHSHSLTLWPPHLVQSPQRHQALCYSLFLQKPTQDISLLRIFQLSNIVLHPYQPVQCVCVCVCVCVCASLAQCLKTIVDIFFFFFYNIFHLDVHYVCMLVHRFEPQGRRFTNFHYYYYYWPPHANSKSTHQIRLSCTLRSRMKKRQQRYK